MNIYFLCLLTLFSSSASALELSFEIPSGSSLKFKESKYGNLFSGNASILATYQFKYDNNSPYENKYTLYLYPDKESIAKLPFLTFRGFPEVANEIFIHNVKDAAKLLLGDIKANEIISGKVLSINGKAKIEISRFFTSYSCDQPSFTAKISKVINQKKMAAEGILVPRSGC